MAKKPSITTVASGYQSTTTINDNFQNLRNAFDNTLSLDGSVPNAMQADIDMNSNDILNVNSISVDELIIDNLNLSTVVQQTAANATAAAASATASAASYDSFDDRYLGAKATAPTLDNDGNALLTGALYWNTTSSQMFVRSSSASWINYEATSVAAASTATTQAGVATTQAGIATTQAGLAATARTGAETARDAAFVNANVYATTAAGLAATTNGQQFQVVAGTQIVRYRNDSGAATEVARYPAASAIVDTDPLFTSLEGYVIPDVTFGTTAASGTPLANRMQQVSAVAPSAGYLQSLSVWVQTLGTGAATVTIGVLRANGNVDIIGSSSITGISSTGAKTLVAGTNFTSYLYVPAGAYIFIGSATGGAQFAAQAVSGIYCTAGVVGTNVTANSSSYVLLATATIGSGTPLETVLAPVEEDANRANFATVSNATIERAYGRTNPSTGDMGSAFYIYSISNGEAIPCDGWLTGVQYRGAVAGAGVFEIWLGASGSAVLVDSFNATLAVGNNVAAPPEPIKVAAGSYVFFNGRDGAGRLDGSNNAVGLRGLYFDGSHASGSGVYTTLTTTPLMRPVVSRPSTTQEVISTQVRGQTLLGRDFFPSTSTPSGWTISGWTVNNGLQASGTGSYAAIALFDTYSNAQRKTTTMRFSLTDATSKFGFCFYPLAGPTDGWGTVALLDASAGAASAILSMYSWTGTGSPTGSGATVAVPFTLVTGRDYVLKIRKVKSQNIFTLIDSVTQESVTLTDTFGSAINFGYATGGNTGFQWGKAGAVFLSGNVTVKIFERFTDVAPNPHWVWFGDSRGEGAVLSDQMDFSYVNLLEDMRGKGDTISMCRSYQSGDQAAQSYAIDLTALGTPKYAVWDLGVNPNKNVSGGSSDAVYQAALAASVATFIAALPSGTIPVFIAPTPYDGNSGRILLARSAAVDFTYGRYPFVDACFPLSTANNGVAFNPIYTVDTLHPNPAGNNRILQQILNDAPFLA